MSKLLLPRPSHASSSSYSFSPRHLLHRAYAAFPHSTGGFRNGWPPPRYAFCFPILCRVLAGASTSEAGLTGGERDGGLPFVKLSSEILRAELSSLKDDDAAATSANNFPLDDEKPLYRLLLQKRDGDTDRDRQLGETPAYPAAMNALYAACLAGNVIEQLWNLAWPAAIATLHPSLIPVAVLGFFSKTMAHLVSAAMITHAFTLPPTSLLLRPWFAALVASTAVDRLSCVCLGIIAERDFVVQLAGRSRPVALAKANATLSRVDLLCETAGASVFAVLLSRNDPLTCINLSCVISLCALPLLVSSHLSNIFMGGEMNRLADGIFDHSEREIIARADSSFSIRRKFEEAVGTIRRGWGEYVRQPVLPASLAYVLVCFNVALAPGALMTTFLIHHGVGPAVRGAFGGSSAAMGILATFVTPRLVKELGILKAGAAGLVTQSALLGAAALVYLAGGGPASQHGGALFVFLALIVASRAGHMAYSVVGLQLVQTGNPAGKAKLIGATEVAVASLAELAMMAVVAVVARDAARFGLLAVLSAASVAAAACLFCAWMAKPSEELGRLFPCG
ncbi:hypothetical protein PR202_gb24995 [Eleusine coracana subsp. coracana]|uniref:Solute carrier family 40 member n=1 Tax=Eleusine coracana subsp. coracana TaxID=191504 RepID=A0AAV5FN32_ELECO|nr:hypothetical protein PR202_gb24995 [Eleusine coracana subsp. coracana]